MTTKIANRRVCSSNTEVRRQRGSRPALQTLTRLSTAQDGAKRFGVRELAPAFRQRPVLRRLRRPHAPTPSESASELAALQTLARLPTAQDGAKGFELRPSSGAFPSPRSLVLAFAHFALLAILALAAPPTQAATRTWSGGAPLLNVWSIAANWSGGVAPVAGDNLVFPLGAARMTNRNDFPAGTAFGSITFLQGGYVVTGNALSPASIIASHVAGTTTFLADLQLANALTLDAMGLRPTLIVSNLFASAFDVTVSGSGLVTVVGELDVDAFTDFRKTGSGRLTLDPNRTIFMDATVTIDEGSVWLLETIHTDFVVNSGGTLRGDGYVGSLTSNGGIIAPGTDEIGSIFAFDSIVFNAATRLQLRVNSRFDYDYLGLSLTQPTALALGGSQLELAVASAVEVGDLFAIVDAHNAGSVITGRFAGHPEGSRFTEDGFTFGITYQGGDHSNSVVLTVVDVPPSGVTRTWDGGGTNNNWTTPANWVGDVAPSQGDDLVFPAGAARSTNVNNFSSGWTFNSILFTGSNYVTTGNEILLRAGLTNTPSRGTNLFACPLTLLRDLGIRFGASSMLELAGVIDNDGHDLTVSGAGSGVASRPITGAGNLIKLGAGTLALGASNSYSGFTLVSNGVLAVTHPGALGLLAADTLIATGAVLRVQGGVSLPEPLRLAGALWSEGGTNELTGSASLLETNVTLRVDAGAELLVTSPLLGTGGFVKTGAGRMTTEGPQPFSGKAAVQAGTLIVNGVHSNSVITLDGGRLGGGGFAGSVRGLNGVLSPGASPGRLRADDVRLEATTAFDVEINGATAGSGYDQLEVNGVVTLVNAALRLTRSYIPAESDRFTIIDNRGADEVFGTFLGLPEGAVFTNGTIAFEITYLGGDGNDVVLARLAPPRPLCPTPQLFIRRLTNNAVELSWPSCPSNFYQLAWTTNFQRWEMLTPPLAAPETNSVMTWTTPTSLPHQFFQLVVRPLPLDPCNGPVPLGYVCKRNVLFVVLDDVGVDQLPIYANYYNTNSSTTDDMLVRSPAPNPAATTPTIDRLAASGVTFLNAWSSPTCSPSRAGFYTGTASFRHGVYSPNAPNLATNATTIAHVLGANGYANGLFGKWHLGDDESHLPFAFGWNRHEGGLEGDLPDYYDWTKTINVNDTTGRSSTHVTVTNYATHENVANALTWIGAQTTPWMTTMTFNAPHWANDGTGTYYQFPPDGCANATRGSTDKAKYRSMLECADTSLNDLLSGIDSNALAQTTIILIGDNGTEREITDHFPAGHNKSSLYEGGINVPLIIADGYTFLHGTQSPWAKGLGRVVSPGRFETNIVQTMDVFATAAEIGRGDASCGVDSVSMVPYLSSAAATPCRAVTFAETYSGGDWNVAVRNQTHKLIVTDYCGSAPTYELYDLTTDRWETTIIPEDGTSVIATDLLANLAVLLAVPSACAVTPENPVPTVCP
jgi:autotransporter-associated beta strand protein